VDFLALCADLRLDRPRFRYRRETLLRQTVAEKLCAASRLLPEGVQFNVIEGWRAPHIQARMYRATWNWWRERRPTWSEATLRRVVNRFTAPTDDPRVPPPHTTGAALDVMLVGAAGEPMDLCAPYDPFDPRGFSFDATGLSPTARESRRMLREALETVGITNYPSEYWHWSYGDQGWAYRGNHLHALYGAVTPPGWSPAPEDLIDAPLEAI
jgi:D-alanyl-D-alanine dipeptidase